VDCASIVFAAAQRMQSHSICIFISLCIELALFIVCVETHVAHGGIYFSANVLS
jgi:hypothetical protein